jgi:hypothetical protein
MSRGRRWAAILFVVASALTGEGAAGAQEAADVPPSDRWSLQFGVSGLGSFGVPGGSFFVQRGLNPRLAVRAGASVTASHRSDEETATEYGFGPDTTFVRGSGYGTFLDVELSSQVVFLGSARHGLRPIVALGPFVRRSWREAEETRNAVFPEPATTTLVQSDRDWRVGLSSQLGIEWAFSRRVGLLAQYGVQTSYSTGREVFTVQTVFPFNPSAVRYSRLERRNRGFHVTSGPVWIGLSAYL